MTEAVASSQNTKYLTENFQNILTTENTENTEENQALTTLNISGNF